MGLIVHHIAFIGIKDLRGLNMDASNNIFINCNITVKSDPTLKTEDLRNKCREAIRIFINKNVFLNSYLSAEYPCVCNEPMIYEFCFDESGQPPIFFLECHDQIVNQSFDDFMSEEEIE